jgi:ABC-2 type transport system ATP-binding protein
MLLSVLTPTSGDIVYFGKDLSSHRSEILQNVSFASTYINLPWRLTVKENLLVYGKLYGLSRNEIVERMKHFLGFFGISDKINKVMSFLSAGQLTRVMLVKAFLAYPKVVLLDEPTASLDPDVAVQVREFVQHQREKYKVSVLFTSHNMNEVHQVCDRVIFLRKGKIVAKGKPEELAAKAKSTNLRLKVGDGLKRTKILARKMDLDYQVIERDIEIKIEEKRIAEFLSGLAKIGVDYYGIDIVKPTLEDYFIQLSSIKDKDE